MSHTPGPWYVDTWPGYGCDSPQRYRVVAYVDDSGSTNKANVFGDIIRHRRREDGLYEGGPQDNETFANAALAAAAPRLLEVAKLCKGVMDSHLQPLQPRRGGFITVHESYLENMVLWLGQAIEDAEEAA